jgi:VCBS repeat protein
MAGKRRHRLLRAVTLGGAGVLVGVIVAFAVWNASSSRANRFRNLRSPEEDMRSVVIDAAMESRVEAFCSDCHAMPNADSFLRQAWHDEVQRGYQFYAKSGRNDLDPPPMHLTVAYFQSRARDEMVFPKHVEAETELRATFAVEQRTLNQDVDIPPAVSHIRWTSLEPEGPPVLLVSDMRFGYVGAVDLHDQHLPPRILARLNCPCHIEPCDLDGDQAIDLVVADLGSIAAADHDRGRVVWLRRRDTDSSFEEIVLASGFGRVADVQPSDLDADGDLDLIVADFGHFRTGKIVILRNVAEAGERPRFKPEEIDPRPGTIHVPPHDFNRDGLPDFVALVSQEYESVDAFINRGDGQFRLQTLWAAPSLTFGSSGIELVDMDQDDDMDILYTNGDTFDNSYVNASHGIQWLENLGGLEFDYHRLTDMTGAYCALAGDIDLDGDLDVIAAASLPRHVLPSGVKTETLPSILCLEQTQPGVFVRHTLETGFPRHATIELADFDGDGDLDLAAGSWIITVREKSPGRSSPSLSIWWNQTIPSGE